MKVASGCLPGVVRWLRILPSVSPSYLLPLLTSLPHPNPLPPPPPPPRSKAIGVGVGQIVGRIPSCTITLSPHLPPTTLSLAILDDGPSSTIELLLGLDALNEMEAVVDLGRGEMRARGRGGEEVTIGFGVKREARKSEARKEAPRKPSPRSPSPPPSVGSRRIFGASRRSSPPSDPSYHVPPVDDDVESELDNLDSGCAEDLIAEETASGVYDSDASTYDPESGSEEEEEEEDEGEGGRGRSRPARGGGERRGNGEGFDLSGV